LQELLEKLDKNDSVINRAYGADSSTLLHMFVENRSITDTAAVEIETKMAENLLKHGANPNIQNEQGRTPIFCPGSADRAKLLLEYGAQTDIVDNDEDTPLSFAIFIGYDKEIIKLLICENGENIKKVNIYGRSPLSFACERNKDIVDLLLSYEDIVDEKSVDYARYDKNLLEKLLGNCKNSELSKKISGYLEYLRLKEIERAEKEKLAKERQEKEEKKEIEVKRKRSRDALEGDGADKGKELPENKRNKN
jgi:hypothetical protein